MLLINKYPPFSPFRKDETREWVSNSIQFILYSPISQITNLSSHGYVSPLPPLPLCPLLHLSVTNLPPWSRPPPRPCHPAGQALCCGVEHAHGPLSPALQRPSGFGPLWYSGEPTAALFTRKINMTYYTLFAIAQHKVSVLMKTEPECVVR